MRTGTLLLLGGVGVAAAVAYNLVQKANAVKQLKVSVKGLRHSSSNFTQTKMLLTLSVYNPNNVSLPFQRVYGQVKIEGSHFAEFDISGSGQTIGPLTTRDLEVPVLVEHFSAATTIFSLIQKIIRKEKFTTPFDVQGTLYAAGLQLPINARVNLADFGVGRANCIEC